MRVFVTGASGAVGSAVVPELLATGHNVVGLARSDASAEALAAAGAEVQRGELADLESLRVAAAQSDGVIHLAFSNDFTNLDEGIAEETGAIETLCGALEGSDKPLVIVSGTPVVPGRASTEQDPTMTEGPVGGRGRASLAALAYAERGVRVGLVRLPRSVHAAGGPYGFASLLVAAAQRTGVSGYVGDGTQRWPAVHRLDAARLFRLVLEQGQPGTIAHAVGDEGDDRRDDRAGAQPGDRGGPSRELRGTRHDVRHRPAGLQHADSRTVRLGPHPPQPARRPPSRELPGLTRVSKPARPPSRNARPAAFRTRVTPTRRQGRAGALTSGGRRPTGTSMPASRRC